MKSRYESARGRASRRGAALAAGVLLALAARAAVAGPLPDNPRYVFEAMGHEAGLATRTANAMVQDAVGFIWLGTGDGVYRFDGVAFERFAVDEGLPGVYVTQLLEDRDGRIWVAVTGELAWFDGLRFQRLDLGPALPLPRGDRDTRQRMAIGADGTLYVTYEDRLLAVDPGRRTLLREWTDADGLPGGVLRAIHGDRDGRLWFVTDEQVGYLESPAGPVVLLEATGLPDDVPIAVLRDGDGTLWVRTLDHLVRLDEAAGRFVPDPAELGQAVVHGLPTLDQHGQLLVPTKAGLFMRSGGRWRSVAARHGLPINSVATAFEDRDGALWISLYGAGIQRWHWRGSWSAWTSREGLPEDVVWGSLRDDRQRLWVATNDGIGIWLPDERRWHLIRKDDGLAAQSVWKIVAGPDGRIWSLSRRTGLNRFDPDTLLPEVVEIPPELRGTPLDLAAAPDGRLWLGADGYLATIDPRGAAPVFARVELPAALGERVDSIAATADGALWIGGFAGAGRLYEGTWRTFGRAEGLKAERLMNIAAVSATEAWLGYEEAQGITHLVLDGSAVRLEHLGRDTGLLSDTVWMLERDARGRIWVGSSDGLSVVLPDGAIRTHTQRDGLIWNDIGQDALWMDPDGAVFVGTSRGLAYHQHDDEERKHEPPVVVLTSITLGGRQRLGDERPIVPHGRGTFTARYSGLSFRNPSQVVFRYRLAGVDPEPILTKLREVRYPGLAAGSYVFEVWCRSADGTWSAEPATFAFTVDPPWWERWWFRLAAFVALVLAVLGAISVRTRRLARDRHRLELAVAERSAQLAKANQELREMSFTDALTKVRNRRFFASTIEADVSATLRKHDPRTGAAAARNRDLIFLLIDLDHFKKVNDVHGHMVGDRVLVETARRLERSVRQSDLVVRWGGEEFLVVAREAERTEAGRVAARILELVGGAPLLDESGLAVQRTCSVGYAVLPGYPKHPQAVTHEQLLEIVDKALYLAKETGRNRAIGVELIPEAYATAAALDWLDRPLHELEHEVVRLERIAGPAIPPEALEVPSSVPPPRGKREPRGEP